MKVQEIFNLSTKMGIKADLRGDKRVIEKQKKIKKRYEKMSAEEKADFDKQKLSNPYLDSGVHFDNKKQVKKIMCGIDIDTSELMMAKELGEIDLVIAHHPLGKALADLPEVMPLQVEVLAGYGVPINIAEGCFKIRIQEVARGVNPANHYKTVDAAKLLNINLMNVHTPCDNLVADFLKKKLSRKRFEYVGEIMEFLKSIPEYAEAEKKGAGPKLFAGDKNNFCGKIALTEITGGTSGAKEVYEKMANAGIGTIIGMHMSEENKKEAEKNHLNVIIAGHMSSDSLGVNLFLDELEKKGIKIVPCSGLIRVRR
ncbi:MAG TPA: NGG1p interacting factor NIF3 [Patescibacteria group bacterium]|nr:NGG1p interacting factor NIF3 [Patescibacteria group bacterium]